VKFCLLAAALIWAAPPLATAQVAILHIQVIEGEGAVHAPGSRSARPLTVEVTDETGKPVAGAALSFHLPEEGPGGTFSSGLRTDVAVTDYRGRASLRSLQVNRIAGRFAVRIVASKEQVRAGTVCYQYVAEAPGGAASASRSAAGPAPGGTPRVKRGVFKWIAVAALVGGGVAAGAWAAGRSGGGNTPGPQSPTLTIGTPSITVGKP
jgi:hypothetical protein